MSSRIVTQTVCWMVWCALVQLAGCFAAPLGGVGGRCGLRRNQVTPVQSLIENTTRTRQQYTIGLDCCRRSFASCPRARDNRGLPPCLGRCSSVGARPCSLARPAGAATCCSSLSKALHWLFSGCGRALKCSPAASLSGFRYGFALGRGLGGRNEPKTAT